MAILASNSYSITNVSDGQTTYPHYAYSDNADGTGLTLTDNGQRYQGYYSDYTQADSTDKTKYKWADRWAKIEVGGRNYILESQAEIVSAGGWVYKTFNLSSDLLSSLSKIKTVTISCDVEGRNVTNFNNRKRYGLAWKAEIKGITRYWEVWQTEDTPKKRISWTFTVPEGEVITKIYNPSLWIQATGDIKVSNPKIELGSVPTDHSLAPEDLATVTALNNVTDTVDSHTRTIGAVGTSGSILDNVSKVTQTATGLVQEVSGANGLKTQVSTLAGSYAIKSLTKAGDVLGQINLNKDGSVKIDGSLTQITGTTYIQDGVISSAKIADLDAGKITTGTLDAARIAVNSIDGSKLVFDQAFFNGLTANEAYLKQIFAKNAFITQVQAVAISASKIQGGIMEATNGAVQINLNDGAFNFYTDSPAIRRSVTNLPNQFVKFATATEANDNTFKVLSNNTKTTAQASVTSIGTNRSNGEQTNDGSFTGINIYASGPATGTAVVDRIGVHSDVMIVSHSVSEGQKGWVFENHNASNNNYALRPMIPRGLSGYSSYIGTETHPITRLYSDDVMLNGHRLKGILKDLANRVGKTDGWAADIS